ncbi:cdc42-interacting protein 4 homolog [Sycon ciliatum]|uniref:cdc42-interacting protein 4 homolog n=1 Tax=Sycon ciliatum TaxID=27933 RepID=UPI0020ADE947|eukprot:scpid53657/ scgid25489/ Cdc42-interacting protein 4 homolog; Thyroid receptor-interacting protein 10 homolog
MWSTDLWDQYDGVCSHLDTRVDQVKRISAFVKDRIKVEQDYAKELRRLSKSYNKMKPEETKFPSTECFSKIVAHADELAQHHESFSTKLQSDVYDALKKLTVDQTKEKKTMMTDATKQQAGYTSALASNDKMKKKYESAQQDSDKAHLAYTKADADMTLSRAAVEKFRKTSDLKQVEADEAKSNFQKSIDETNKVQKEHYHTKMPETFKQFQQLDETRTKEMIQQFVRYISLESELMPLYTESEQKCKTQLQAVNPDEDSRVLVDELQSGFTIPTDIVFEEMSSAPQPEKSDRRSKKASVPTSLIKAAGSKKNSICEESVDLFDGLPPAKRKKKLNSRISDLKTSAKKEEAELKALEKLTSVYTANPSLGDPNVVQQKIAPVIARVDGFNDEMYKLECALAQMENRDPPTAPSSAANMLTTRTSISSSASDFLNVQSNSVNSVADQSDEFDDSVGEVKKSGSMAWGDDFADPGQQKCTVLYDFQATSGSELSVSVGETLELVQDDGSGWISVRRGDAQGYIPLSYVDMS